MSSSTPPWDWSNEPTGPSNGLSTLESTPKDLSPNVKSTRERVAPYKLGSWFRKRILTKTSTSPYWEPLTICITSSMQLSCRRQILFGLLGPCVVLSTRRMDCTYEQKPCRDVAPIY